MNNGDIIQARVRNVPGIFHFGIIVIEGGQAYVFHNTPFRGTVCDPLPLFLRTRYGAEFRPSKLSGRPTPEIVNRFEQCKGNYHLLSFNCEHFIDCMMDQPYESPQLVRAIVISGIIGLSLTL